MKHFKMNMSDKIKMAAAVFITVTDIFYFIFFM